MFPRPLRVYIAGPITKGDLAANIQRATDTFERLALHGFAPFCPLWACFSGRVQLSPTGGTVYAVAGGLPNSLTYDDWLRVDVEWVRASDALLRLPGESKGADMEIEAAREAGVPVFFNEIDLKRWALVRRSRAIQSVGNYMP